MQLRVGVRGVEVRAPSWVPEGEIGQFVLQKKEWIERALGAQEPGADVLACGGTLYVLGMPYQLEVLPADDGAGPCLEELMAGWRVRGSREAVCRLLAKWYYLKAEREFAARVIHWAGKMGRTGAPRVIVKDQQRSWGSYSARTRSVSLNWRMLAFPPEIIDYVVVHELCHAGHMHHARSFWDEVGLFCPEWRQRRLWLRTHARKYLF